MLEFNVATDHQLAEEDGIPDKEKVVDFTIAGKLFKARRPTAGQVNVLFSSRRTDSTMVVWQIFDRILVRNAPKTPPAERHAQYEDLRALVFDGVIDPALLFGGDELNESGILDSIIKEFAGRPTQSPEASSESPQPTGRRSTGRSPSKTSSPSD